MIIKRTLSQHLNYFVPINWYKPVYVHWDALGPDGSEELRENYVTSRAIFQLVANGQSCVAAQ